MDYELEWADEAKENYRRITSYLLDAYGFKTADQFTDSINEKVALLQKSPFMGRRLESLTAIRRLPLATHNVLYYNIVGRRITVLNILDGRKPFRE